MCSLYRHTSLGPTDGSYYDGSKVLIASGLGNSGTYSTTYIGTAGNWPAPGYMQFTLDCGGSKFYASATGTTTNSSNYYDNNLKANVSINGKTVTLSFSSTTTCPVGSVNWGDGTSSNYVNNYGSCTASVSKTYVNSGTYQIMSMQNGSIVGSAYITVQ
jgi:hypothetical protein